MLNNYGWYCVIVGLYDGLDLYGLKVLCVAACLEPRLNHNMFKEWNAPMCKYLFWFSILTLAKISILFIIVSWFDKFVYAHLLLINI